MPVQYYCQDITGLWDLRRIPSCFPDKPSFRVCFAMSATTPTRRFRQAKIVAPLGPASSSPEMIRGLFDAGADVFRFNFSHGSHEEHRRRYEIVRDVERETGRPIAVLADLQGPKLRVG